MLIVIIRCPVREGAETEFMVRAERLAKLARTETGCRSWRVARDTVQSSVIALVEEWTDRSALEAHLQNPRCSELAAPCVELQSGESEYGFYEVADAE